MAQTAHENEEMIKEYHDTWEILEEKVNLLADMVKQSKHLIMFTGAGISTSAGIPDYRGPQGVWTLLSQGKQASSSVSILEALPTRTHMSIVKLMEQNILKYLVSQNCDGLHRKSGIPKNQISELHGNANIEICTKCKKEYLRDFDASSDYPDDDVTDHRTGRRCDDPKCNGILVDSIINFGEDLPKVPLDKAYMHAEKSDLCIVLGSSLTVTPASNIPEKAAERGKLVICNLQKTPLDDEAHLRIFAKCDVVIQMLMKKLKIEIPPFLLKRKISIKKNNGNLLITGLDEEGDPFSCIKSVRSGKTFLNRYPFELKMDEGMMKSKTICIEIEFMGHYGESIVKLPQHPIHEDLIYDLSFEPFQRKWNVNVMSCKDSTKKSDIQISPETSKIIVGNSIIMDEDPMSEEDNDDDDDGGGDQKKMWKFFVKDTEEKKIISKVKLALHSPNNINNLTLNKPPYQIECKGGNIFKIISKIFFNPGLKKKHIAIEHYIDLSCPETIQIIPLK